MSGDRDRDGNIISGSRSGKRSDGGKAWSKEFPYKDQGCKAAPPRDRNGDKRDERNKRGNQIAILFFFVVREKRG